MRNTITRFLPLLIAVLVITAAGAAASEFSADVVMGNENQIINGKIMVIDSVYRLQMFTPGQQIYIIVNQHANMTAIVSVNDEKYMVVAADDPVNLQNDPIEAARFMSQKVRGNNIGADTVAGLLCDRIQYSQDGNTSLTEWHSRKLDFPVKIISGGPDSSFMRLESVEVGPVERSLVTVPASYTERRPPAKDAGETPVWDRDLSSIMLVSPPFDSVMKADEVIRIAVPDDGKLEVDGKNGVNGTAAFFAVPYREGKPVYPPVNFLHFLKGEGREVTVDFDGALEGADDVVVYIREGSVAVRAR